jgi:hypothetical protein
VKQAEGPSFAAGEAGVAVEILAVCDMKLHRIANGIISGVKNSGGFVFLFWSPMDYSLGGPKRSAMSASNNSALAAT